MSGEDLSVTAAMRPAEEVMRLARLGSSFPTRLSFMRTLIRQLASEAGEVTRPVWEIDDEGFGRAVYTVQLTGHEYSLVAFSTALAPENRTDRVIAEAWDSSYVLFDGVPTTADLDRLEAAVPRQESARYRSTELCLSRANKSVRLFEHVASSLASGRQPDQAMLASVGYLMRTTAVYGNGKFGISDRANFADRPGMGHPFRAEMLSVWLIRGFTIDLVNHVGQRRSPETAIALDKNLQRQLGIGNATGLGMAPFLVNHPILFNNWMTARETAIARVRVIEFADRRSVRRVGDLLSRAQHHVAQWQVDDVQQTNRIATLDNELSEVVVLLDESWFNESMPWDRLMTQAHQWSLETQELLAALLVEAHPDLVDDLAADMASVRPPCLDATLTVDELGEQLAETFSWALDIDFDSVSESAQFWYISEEKLEPRLGLRYEEPGAELEQPLDVARQVKGLAGALAHALPAQPIAAFLCDFPEHRNAALRVQTAAMYPYAEIRDNLISECCLPVDMLRAKLAFFGASKFDPKSDRWTRITLYQGAPLFGDIADPAPGFDADDWWLPVSAAS
jgi:hypothetical protein